MAAGSYTAYINYLEPITAETLNITFDGVLYENVPRMTAQGSGSNEIYYGSSPENISLPPFSLVVEPLNPSGIELVVAESGEHTISVSIPSQTEVTTTPCFDKARGYSCIDARTLLTEETVTTVTLAESITPLSSATLTYATPIDAETLIVTFNGTEYECERNSDGFGYLYGANVSGQSPDFSQYPFFIYSDNESTPPNFIYTENEGTYSVKIESAVSSVEVSDCFKRAVETAFPLPLILDENDGYLDKTFAEIKDAYLRGRTVLLDPINTTPILRDAQSKSYRSMVELDVNLSSDGGGDIVFGGAVTSTFRAATDDEYPSWNV